MRRIKSPRGTSNSMKPLASGQVWKMDGMNLEVGLVGTILVHYKLGKPDASRIPNSLASKTTLEKFLKKNKAVLGRKKTAKAMA